MIEPLVHLDNKDNNDIKEYSIDKYDELCEEHFKIKKIVPLKQPQWKFILDIFLSLTLVKFYIYGFSDRLVKFMKYQECTLEEAEILGIYCCDGNFYFEELKKITLPNVANSFIKTSQLNFARKCYLFTFKLFNYIYNPGTKTFNSVKFSIFCSKDQIFEYMSKGLNKNERDYQKLIYGECDLNFKINSFFYQLFLTTCKFFFIFQVYSIVLWISTEYYAYSCAIAFMTIYDLLEETITTLSNLKSIRKISKYSIKVKIYQKNDSNNYEILEKDSTELVPGDIFELPEDGNAMPCDCILLSGSIIINEAMLTGESTPIMKTHLPNLKQDFDEENDIKYFLFAGTKIVQKRKENKMPVIALCYSTGFNSVKGNLIRSILYPVKGESKFEKESMKFIIFLAIVCTVGFLSVLPVKIDHAKKKDDKTKEYTLIALQGLDLITTAVPPTLPCCLGIGIGIAQSRFKKKHIMCINRNKITPAGKISICVFDKTGTLTEDHLDIAGFIPVYARSKSIISEGKKNISNFSHNSFFFGRFYESMKDLSKENFQYYKEKSKDPSKKSKKEELMQLFIECLACCQSITRVNGKLVGDPIDVGMFESTGWELIEDPEDTQNYDPKISTTFVRPSQEKSLTEKIINDNEANNEKIDDDIKNHYEIGIIRRFDFSSKLQRMTVIGKNLMNKNFMSYCKGSPEKIRELCMPKTIPENFNDKLNYYTSKGYRVLALACKVIEMNISESIQISRDFCEKDLVFLGLLIVENKLKEVTEETLKILSEKANVRIRMATGDNILTAICVGRKSNLIDPDGIIYSCEIEKEENKNENISNFHNNENNINTNIYDNSLLKEREKENIKRKLVWKAIENFKEEEEKDEENDGDKALNDIEDPKNNNRNSNISFLMPQEIEEGFFQEEKEDYFLKLKNEKNANKKKEEENENEDNIEIDLSSLPFDKDNLEGNIQIAITGKTFETLYRLNQKYENSIKKPKSSSPAKLNINDIDIEPIDNINDFSNIDVNKIIDYKQFHEAFRLVLKYCSIYARCSPENKTQIVESLQKESFTVLMCGDGANDCGALKVADVGISLSTEEASIAAPFTSSIPDISCVIEVLKEGKCALVTSFQIFKYIILYSMIQFISVTFLLLKDSYLTDWQFMVEDLFIITPLAFLMPLTPAFDELTYHRPVGSLFSFGIIFSMILQTLCVAWFQLFSYFLMNKAFPKNDKKFRDNFCDGNECEYGDNFRYCTSFNDDYEDNCIDNSVIFYISFAQLLILCIVFAKGKPFKKSIFHNLWLFIFSIILFIYSEYIVFYVDPFSEKVVEIMPFPDDSFYFDEHTKPKYHMQFKFLVMILILADFIVCLFIEKILLPKMNRFWNKMRMDSLKIRVVIDKENEADLNLINNIQNYVKEQKILEKQKI